MNDGYLPRSIAETDTWDEFDRIRMTKGGEQRKIFARVDKMVGVLVSRGEINAESVVNRKTIKGQTEDYEMEKRASLYRKYTLRAEIEHIARQRFMDLPTDRTHRYDR